MMQHNLLVCWAPSITAAEGVIEFVPKEHESLAKHS